MSGAGLNYTIVGGFRFYERAEIKDALAYLRYLANPSDTVSLLRALRTPRRGIGDVTAGRIESFLKQWDGDPLDGLEAAAGIAGRAAAPLKTFASAMKKYSEAVDEREIGSLTRDLLEEVGYFDMLISEGTIEAESRLDNLGELISGMEEFTEQFGEEAGLHRFLAEVSLLTDVDEWEDEGETVTLMTMHSAKGLEYPVVFLTGMEEELCPLLRDGDDTEALEEERRLCYVGMTRAREELYLSRARRRRRWGNVQQRLPSRFLGEIPPGLLESVDQLRLVSHRIDRADAMPDYENENQDAPFSYQVGQTVEHPTLGSGRILEVTGKDDKTRLVVAFASAGTKRLLAKYSNLQVVEWS
jgi:DNA helicase-2/ATP-dependent DNA helicase PcrA